MFISFCFIYLVSYKFVFQNMSNLCRIVIAKGTCKTDRAYTDMCLGSWTPLVDSHGVLSNLTNFENLNIVLGFLSDEYQGSL